MRRFLSRSAYGGLMLLIGAVVAIPLLVLPFYPQDAMYIAAFAIPAAGSAALGALCCLTGDRKTPASGWKNDVYSGSLTVLFAWGWGTLIGALPFLLGGRLTFVQSLFEAVSGWTTTGLSVLDVTVTPHIYLVHRSFMQFCGGIGFVMMMVALVQDKNSMNLYSAEGHPDKLRPNLRKTAQTIALIYCGFLAAGTAAYLAVGMNLFESLCHTMCSLSTGGFSTRLNSIGEYRSFPIELVTVIEMLIGTTNFAVLLLLVRRKWRQVIQVSEVRFLFLLLLLFVPVTALSLMGGLGMGAAESFRRALFDVSSALSTTGYSTMSYASWPELAVGVLILMMLVGGGIGSTAGGIKLSRVHLMLRVAGQSIRRRVQPARRVEAPYCVKAQGRTEIDAPLTADTAGFIACYLTLYAVGSLLLTVTARCSLRDALFEFASALGTVGLSIGITGPATGNATLLVEIAGMLLGRLEIFIILTGFWSVGSLLQTRMRRRRTSASRPQGQSASVG